MFILLLFLSDVDEMVHNSQVADGKGEISNSFVQGCSSAINVPNTGICDKKTKKVRQYKVPEHDKNIDNFSKKCFALQSKCKMKWAVNLYSGWRTNRLSKFCNSVEIVRADLDKLHQFNQNDLCYSLCRFIREVKKLNGEDFPPNTVREIVIMLQMYLHENGIYWHLLDHPQFVTLCNVLDNTMKERHSMGLGVKVSSEIISMKHEDTLFANGLLSEDTPAKLLKTIVNLMGMHCALRGGVKHNRLRHPGSSPQISFERDKRGIECMVYKEDPLQKTNQGGLICKLSNKTVYVYPSSNRERCPLHLYKKYVSLLPKSLKYKKLYLRCRKNLLPNLWYCDQPYGLNKVKTTVKELCKLAGITSKFTSHSLRVTCASRMYDHDIPEQIIKEVTGHKSDCVCAYK